MFLTGLRGNVMDVFVARQPIFDRELRCVAYELLFRDGISNAMNKPDGDAATLELLSHSFLSIGLDTLSHQKICFINFTQNLLLQKLPLAFPKENFVVEVLENVIPDTEVLTACRDIHSKGYTLALDDFINHPAWDPLLNLVQYVKIDFLQTATADMISIISRLQKYSIELIAEKVENRLTYKVASRLGFSYFQGYFFCRPQIIRSREVPSSKIHLLTIMAQVRDPNITMTNLEKVISRDVGISFKLLNYLNSAYFFRGTTVKSIKQALILLGLEQLTRFISVITLTSLGSDKTDELIRLSSIRGRFCELTCPHCGLSGKAPELFTTGLFSLIDTLLDNTMERLLEKLPLSDVIKDALIGGSGKYASILSLVIQYEAGNWNKVDEFADSLGVSKELLPANYLSAIQWADAMIA
jgi:c-di-GMP-related signal transduction protein